jgi:ABC-type bacteriocin/lantibiotic exporter with double-glycine peptidase domain
VLVLVLDEATSAIDQDKEREIIDEIRRWKGDLTMVVIAHRCSTIEHCDRVYRLDDGRLTGAVE